MSVTVTPFIRTVLKLDAAFGVTAAVAFILGGSFIGGLTGLPQSLLLWAGVALIPYVGLLLFAARRNSVSRLLMLDIVLINAAWVAVSLGLLAAGAIQPNGLGVAMDLAQAAVVAGFAAIYAGAMRESAQAAT